MRGFVKFHRTGQLGEQTIVTLPFWHKANSIPALLQSDFYLCPVLAQRGNTTHTGDNYSLHLTKTAIDGNNLTGDVARCIA